jgi:phosphoglycerate dehydrogenase-like enzyme
LRRWVMTLSITLLVVPSTGLDSEDWPWATGNVAAGTVQARRARGGYRRDRQPMARDDSRTHRRRRPRTTAESRQLVYLGPEETLDYVRSNLPGFNVRLALDDAAVDAVLPGCAVILDAYMRIRFPADRLARARTLRAFVTATTGADHVDAGVLRARGIPLLTLRDQAEFLKNVTPAAEHSWLLLMACARGLPAAVADVHGGRWDRNRHPGIMLRGRTLGIIGCGRIGQWMSRYAAAFGMRTLGFDPFVAPWPEGIEKCTLEQMLPQSDFVTVHVPLTEESRELVGRRAFALMKPGVVFVNTSRGEVIDEDALFDGLRSGRVRAAGLDVLRGEPETARHTLVEYARAHANLIVTPHIGGFSPDALRYVLEFCCRRIRGLFAA